ncbi:MAG: hypothetical protein JNK02_05910 [Planctomycetes bacterium]|nr:hypothetical protein [Planctomycetota bacterium]
MQKFVTLSAGLALAAVVALSAGLGARSIDGRICDAHARGAAVSDPEPNDCLLCAGNPQAHVRAVWGIQKEIARVIRARML